MKTLALLMLAVAAPAAAGEWPIHCRVLAPGRAPLVDNPFKAVTRARSAWHSVYRQASWRVVYSPASVARFEPYLATLSDGVWHVIGTPLQATAGRGPEAYVCASDGHTLAMGRDD